VLKNKQFDIELFYGITPLRARPTGEALRGIYGWPGETAGHADRHAPLKSYCKGLLLPGERKSGEPMAARLAPDNVRRMHQSLHHLVADARWNDGEMLAQLWIRRSGNGANSAISNSSTSRSTAEICCLRRVLRWNRLLRHWWTGTGRA
jgi:DDE superfamily endonuclease